MKRLLAVLAALAALCAALAGCAKTEQETALSAGEMRVTYLDVGKGDCILIEKDGSFVLIDAGYADTAEDVIAFLQDRGVETLDAMVVTHYDKDHVGGAAAVVRAFAVKQLYLPGYEGSSKHYTALMTAVAEQGIPCLPVTEDASFTLAEIGFTVFASSVAYVSGGEKEANDNDVSLVISAVFGKDSYLFAGDIEKPGISAYLAAGRGTYDVVKMPHHGGVEKNTDDFLADVQPKIAVITDSADEPADEETLTLLSAAGAETWRTSQSGTITVVSSGEGTYQVKGNA